MIVTEEVQRVVRCNTRKLEQFVVIKTRSWVGRLSIYNVM